MNDELLKQCITDIVEQAEATYKDPSDELRDGKLLAFNEVLSIIKTNLTPLGVEKYGLDFDIDMKLA